MDGNVEGSAKASTNKYWFFVQAVWVSVFTKVREHAVSLESMPILNDEDEYVQEIQKVNF